MVTIVSLPQHAQATVCGVDICPTAEDFVFEPIIVEYRVGDAPDGLPVPEGLVGWNSGALLTGTGLDNCEGLEVSWKVEDIAFNGELVDITNFITNVTDTPGLWSIEEEGSDFGADTNRDSAIQIVYTATVTSGLAGCEPLTFGFTIDAEYDGEEGADYYNEIVLTITPAPGTVLSGPTTVTIAP